jgi:hypothetical protein
LRHVGLGWVEAISMNMVSESGRGVQPTQENVKRYKRDSYTMWKVYRSREPHLHAL